MSTYSVRAEREGRLNFRWTVYVRDEAGALVGCGHVFGKLGVEIYARRIIYIDKLFRHRRDDVITFDIHA